MTLRLLSIVLMVSPTLGNANPLFDNPVPLSRLLAEGFEIKAVMTPNFNPRFSEADAEFVGDGFQWKREVYLQRGDRAAICIFTPSKLESDCYDMTKGER